MLSHLEFEQIKRALDRMRTDGSGSSYNAAGGIRKDDVLEILLPHVEGYQAPNPHPTTLVLSPETKT